MLLTARLKGREQIDDAMALSLTALESACLPRHRQEQLGRLVRLAVRKVGKTLHVLANPDNPTEIMVE